MLTGNLDADVYILTFLDDQSLANWSQTCHYTNKLYHRDKLWLAKIRFTLSPTLLDFRPQYNLRYYYHHAKQIIKKSIHQQIIYAARVGSLELVKWSHCHGSAFYNLALKAAAKGGYIEIVAWLGEHGARYWDWGLTGAVESEQTDVIAYCIERGANNWAKALEIAEMKNNRLMIQYFQDID